MLYLVDTCVGVEHSLNNGNVCLLTCAFKSLNKQTVPSDRVQTCIPLIGKPPFVMLLDCLAMEDFHSQAKFSYPI